MAADYVEKSIFMRILHLICWSASCALTVACCFAIAYQLYALYIPYLVSRITQDEAYRFPEYFYRVWGDEIKYLNYEHWGYLLCSSATASFSVIKFIPEHPFSESSLWLKHLNVPPRGTPGEAGKVEEKKEQ